jgi:predicted DNA-binding transcriptional regulator AlpA
MTELPRLLTPKDLAAIIGYTEKTIKRKASDEPHTLPPRIHALKLLRWHPSDVDAWLRPPVRRVGRPRG